MRKCLFAVQGPPQFLAGLIAMEWYRHVKHAPADAETVLLLYDLLSPPGQEQLLADAIMRLSKVRKWSKVVFINSREMHKICRQNYLQSVKDLRKTIGVDSFDDIYIMRDRCGNGSPLILNSYTQAARITYGDSFGIVGNEAEVELNWRDRRYALQGVKTSLRGLLYGEPAVSGFDAAVLSLPMDWSGAYLKDIPLFVPRKEHVLNIIEKVRGQLPDLADYCRSLIKGESDSYLFLLSNLSQAGLMPRENEAALYADVVRQVAPKGSSVVFKNHPRSGPRILNSIIRSLKSDYSVKIIDDANLSKIPVELWEPLMTSCRIVSICSTSAISLAYIYNKDIIFPLNAAKIKKYFYKDQIPGMAKVHQAISEAVNKLKKWDGNSLLWKGYG